MLLGDNISSTACIQFILPHCFSLRWINLDLSVHSSVVSLLATFSELQWFATVVWWLLCLIITPQEKFCTTFPPSGTFSVVASHPWAIISSSQYQEVVFYCTCQCPNFKENFWSPSIYWAKGLRSRQTVCQCLHLLLCARHRCFPQERHSHTAAEGKKHFEINHSLKVCKTAPVHAAEKYLPALSARNRFNICILKKNNELFSEIMWKSSSDVLLGFEDVVSNLEIMLEPTLTDTTREARCLTTATRPVWRTGSPQFFCWLFCILQRSHTPFFSC